MKHQLTIIGIDAGKKGAFAVISDEILVRVEDFKDFHWTAKALTNTLYPLILESERLIVCIEKVQSWGKDERGGAPTAFALGENYGFYQGVLATLNLHPYTVRPQEWKQFYKLIGTTKQASIKKAKEFYPEANLEGERGGTKDGRADAILIARFASKLYRGLDSRIR